MRRQVGIPVFAVCVQVITTGALFLELAAAFLLGATVRYVTAPAQPTARN